MKSKGFKKQLSVLAATAALSVSLLAPAAMAAEDYTTYNEPAAAQLTDMQLAVAKGAIDGYPNDTDYHGSQPATRAELVTMISRAAKLKPAGQAAPFSDLAGWQKAAVASAYSAGIVQGNEKGLFEPERAVTRQEMAVMVASALNKGAKPKVNEKVLGYFKDASDIAEWARPYVAYAVLAGLFNPKLDGTFDPNGAVSRDEAAKALKAVLFERIDILTTNDIHGHIEVGYDKKRQQEQGGIETLGGIVDDFRAVNPTATVVVDGGDAWQGTLISNTTNGQSVMDSMAQIRYDAAAIGNHEFDFGRDVLINNIKNAKFPILGANIYDEKTNKRVEWTQPYTIIERDGLKIGIIGFATPVTKTTTKSTNIEGLDFRDPVPLAKELSAELRKQGCDIVMVTSHLPGDQNAKTNEIMGEMVELANGTGKGTLDAIVGGHSHRRVSGIINGIPVIEAQSWLYAVGHIQLYVDRDSKKVVSSNAGLLETYTNLTTADQDVHNIVADYKAKISAKANEVEGVAAEKISTKSFRFAVNGNVDRDGMTPMGATVTDAMRAAEKSDIAFTNQGGLRSDIDAGNMTYSNMFEVLPFGNYDRTGTMTAQQIKAALEVSDQYSKLPALQFSGLKVKWDATRPAGDRYVSITLTDGTPVYVDGKFNTSRTFSVTTNDFMATGQGDGFTVFGEVKDWKDGMIMLDAWVKYVNDQKAAGKTISVQDDGRDVRLDLKQ
ncbi:5'-nucleotidase [Gordoniibacillus kamchatkensis]|uniref:5'-nucleotidase n=1 Tax=Gordoniibacillus kamchatkensis TaxID=1590651 RepID=A0ABR5AMK7_9BACL|nr:5'-nucleotidase C-terminal domain-containing protein [Paenibacillus sp. VKM B-2647]KIL42272.1 5'-nucleotidase [Paenibacillus sp. VKM B-2647]